MSTSPKIMNTQIDLDRYQQKLIENKEDHVEQLRKILAEAEDDVREYSQFLKQRTQELENLRAAAPETFTEEVNNQKRMKRNRLLSYIPSAIIAVLTVIAGFFDPALSVLLGSVTIASLLLRVMHYWVMTPIDGGDGSWKVSLFGLVKTPVSAMLSFVALTLASVFLPAFFTNTEDPLYFDLIDVAYDTGLLCTVIITKYTLAFTVLRILLQAMKERDSKTAS